MESGKGLGVPVYIVLGADEYQKLDKLSIPIEAQLLPFVTDEVELARRSYWGKYALWREFDDGRRVFVLVGVDMDIANHW